MSFSHNYQQSITAEQVYYLGLRVKIFVERLCITSQYDIVPWRRVLSAKSHTRSEAIFGEQYQAYCEQLSLVNNARQLIRESIEHAIDLVRHVDMVDALATIITAKFKKGRCGELTALAQLALREAVLFNGMHAIQCQQIMVENNNDNKLNHTFLIFGPNLTTRITDLNTLINQPDSIFIYDPFFKILVKANQLLSQPDFVDYCHHLNLNLSKPYTYPAYQKIFSLSKTKLAVFKEEIEKLFKEIINNILFTLKHKDQYGLDCDQTKILTDLLLLTTEPFCMPGQLFQIQHELKMGHNRSGLHIKTR